MAFLASLFAIGTIGFWCFIGLFTILSIISVENEGGGLLTFILVTSAIVLGPQIVAAITIKGILLGIGIYLFLGAVWSIIKWWLYLQSLVEKAKNGYTIQESATNVNYNKSRIINWIALWPFSIFWTLTHDLFTSIYDALAGIYRDMAQKALDKINTVQAAKKV